MLLCLWPASCCPLSSPSSSFPSSCFFVVFILLQSCSFTQQSPSFFPLSSPSLSPNYFGSLPLQGICFTTAPLYTMAGPGCTPLCVYVYSADKENTDAEVLVTEIRFGDFLTYRAKFVVLRSVSSAMPNEVLLCVKALVRGDDHVREGPIYVWRRGGENEKNVHLNVTSLSSLPLSLPPSLPG